MIPIRIDDSLQYSLSLRLYILPSLHLFYTDTELATVQNREILWNITVKYHSDNVVISLSGAESMLGYSYMYLPHHQWVSQEGEIFRWSSPDTLCHPPHSAYYTYNSSELWHAINKHGILIFLFIRKIAQLIETLHKIGHYRGLARLIWKLMSVNVIIRQEYSPFLILLKWCHHKIQIQINNDVQSLVPDKIKNCDDNKNKNQVAHKINN